jgi:hypothetical protein
MIQCGGCGTIGSHRVVMLSSTQNSALSSNFVPRRACFRDFHLLNERRRENPQFRQSGLECFQVWHSLGLSPNCKLSGAESPVLFNGTFSSTNLSEQIWIQQDHFYASNWTQNRTALVKSETAGFKLTQGQTKKFDRRSHPSLPRWCHRSLPIIQHWSHLWIYKSEP